MSDERVTALIADGVLHLTLNRAEKRNAIDSRMIDALLRELDRAQLDAAVKVVLLRGAGPDFCAGADLAELLESVDKSPDQNAADAQRLGDVFIKMRKLTKVVIAGVHGRAFAGGCGLATACDLVVAHEESAFGYPEVKRGFVPAMVMAMLRRAVGAKVAFDLVGTGHILSAAEALRVGLVSRVSSSDEFEGELTEITAAVASHSGSASALIKQQLYEIEGRSFEDAIALGARVNAVARATPDFRSSVADFLGK